MKKIFPIFLCIVPNTIFCQVDTSQSEVVEAPDSTGFGTPDGVLVSKEIGPPGGTIISEDGRVELIFPEGALTTPTTISVQPINPWLDIADPPNHILPVKKNGPTTLMVYQVDRLNH